MLTRRCLAAAAVVVALVAGLPMAASTTATGSTPALAPDSAVPFGTTAVGTNAVSDPNAPIVGMAPTHDGGGYWLVGSDGGIFSYGDALFFGSTGALRLNAPIVGLAAAPDGGGYWLVARDGGIFNYGDAGFFGSAGAIHLNAPIVGMAATGDGGGYWLVASDGGVFTYGDARFWGSTGGTQLNAPVVGMAATPSGDGYWLVARDGGIFSYGDAPFSGSTGALHLNKPVVGMAAAPDGGYWLVASDGGIFSFGSAAYFGSLGGTVLPAAVVGMAATPSGGGYWLVLGSGALAGKVVGIDPGHNGLNGSDADFIDQPVSNGTGDEPCDTTGTETASGYTEAEFNFTVATDLQADLAAQGATVVLTRTNNDGVGPCVTTRAAILNAAAADVAVDIHADGGPPAGSGFSVQEPVADGPNDGVIASSNAFGAVLRDAFVAGTGMPVADYGGAVDGLVPRNDLAGLNLTTVPKVLIEIGNMQNAGDAALEVTASFQQAAADAIAAAITKFLSGSG
ncbi:MAG TPA: N-acetylmuramoyl-L-alanine amidase [Acidimicrobiales bacterium]|nr:N-acetylmuramoyl-L-alanine amidase [Acidimicrobiales bacterium]